MLVLMRLPELLRNDVRMLGAMLGDILEEQAGTSIFERVEQVRSLAKRARAGDQRAAETLAKTLAELPIGEALPVARAFSLFLTLVNIAESHHQLRAARPELSRRGVVGNCQHTFAELLQKGVTPEQLHDTVSQLRVELVLTAHPTQVVRRTLLQKYNGLSDLLARRDHGEDEHGLGPAGVEEALRREITSIWDTDEVVRKRPTPQLEARSGLAVLEQVVWHALPVWIRRIDDALRTHTGRGLPLEAAPVRFGSWMGGDRDGNPSVLPETTLQCSWLGRWMAADLFYKDLDALRSELSSRSCSPELRQRVGDVSEPYRELLRGPRDRLANTRTRMESLLEGRTPKEEPWLSDVAELREILSLCYRSLSSVGQEVVARGRLLDTIRRLECFGLTMVRIDTRQESGRHEEVMTAITQHLGLGDYSTWDEAQRQAFLVQELQSRRPLIPSDLPMSATVEDTLGTFRVAKQIGPSALGAYIISMASEPSDVLEVELLQKAVGNPHPQRVVPLFETIDDLHRAGDTMRRLFQIPWYHQRIAGEQEIMIGYSDSAKDGGRLSANWELYKAQESVVSACEEAKVHPTLFHGRGGTVARGGGPTHLAIQSQPAGSVNGTLRVTEQGEMIQAKFGNPRVAVRTLEMYSAAVVDATLNPPRKPDPRWRERMEQLALDACNAYRGVVREDPRFVEYFRKATPEVELGALNIGSRPARRRTGGGISSLRAIPWIFAWTQNRLCLPSWLGVGAALTQSIEAGHTEVLREMYQEWPFFRSTMDLIEMVVAKADPEPSVFYDRGLVPEELQPFGDALRERLRVTVNRVLEVTGHAELLDGYPEGRQGLQLRNPYMDPINMLQVELLRRLRAVPEGQQTDRTLWDAFVVTVNGIAAGMRNTG